MALRTMAALACSLAALFLLTRATGQPLTVALLGVLITLGTSDYRRLRGLNFGQFSSGVSEGRFSGRSG